MFFKKHNQFSTLNKKILVAAVCFFGGNYSVLAAPLIAIYDNCGYCDRKNTYNHSCTIDDKGLLTLTRYEVKDGVETNKISTESLKLNTTTEIKNLIEVSKNIEATGTVQHGSGDLPNFTIIAYPETEAEFEIEDYSMGSKVIDTKLARELSRKTARLCGMEARRLLWRNVLSKQKTP
jgi:hypothetical protein